MDTPFKDTFNVRVADQHQAPTPGTFDKTTDAIEAETSPQSPFQFPFQIYDTSTSMVTQAHVRYGTLNDVEPTNVDTDIALTSDGTWTFYLNVTVDVNGLMTAVELDIALTGQPADSSNNGYITLGQVIVLSGAITTINQAATHSLRMAMCGRVVVGGTLSVQGVYEFWGF